MSHDNSPVTQVVARYGEYLDDSQLMDLALEYAAQNNHESIIAIKQVFHFSSIQLLWAINYISQNPQISLQTIELLITENFNPNAEVSGRKILTAAAANNNFPLTIFLLSKNADPLFASVGNVNFFHLVNNTQWSEIAKISVLQRSLEVLSTKIRGAREDDYGHLRENLANVIAHDFIGKIMQNSVDGELKNRLIEELIDKRDVLSSDYLMWIKYSVELSDEHLQAIEAEMKLRADEAVRAVLEGDHAFIEELREQENFYSSEDFILFAFLQVYDKNISRESLEIIFGDEFPANMRVDQENNLLTYAIRALNEGLVDFTIDRGADYNFYGKSQRPLSLALQMPECPEKKNIILRLLAESRIQVNFANENGRTPFALACELARSNPDEYLGIVNHIAALSVDVVRQKRVVRFIWGDIEREWVQNADLLDLDILEEMQKFSFFQKSELQEVIEQRLKSKAVLVEDLEPEQQDMTIDESKSVEVEAVTNHLIDHEEIDVELPEEENVDNGQPALIPAVGQASNLLFGSEEHQNKKVRISSPSQI